jgi:hypothetical protein
MVAKLLFISCCVPGPNTTKCYGSSMNNSEFIIRQVVSATYSTVTPRNSSAGALPPVSGSNQEQMRSWGLEVVLGLVSLKEEEKRKPLSPCPLSLSLRPCVDAVRRQPCAH